MRKIFMSFALLTATSILFVSCKKGDIGPEGPAGPAGPTGPTGPIGTANVIYSSWFKFQATDWADSTVINLNTVKRANKFTTAMTQAIVDNGLVMSYIKFDDGANLVGPFQLPLLVPVTGGQFVFNTLTAVGRVVYVGYTIPASGGVAINSIFQFRYIIIPGGIAGKGETPKYNGYTQEELKSMPYEQVVASFNIPADGSN